jgi:Pyruvate/2-oxoacid:ferredoxin oxidoreductase gamma subunit
VSELSALVESVTSHVFTADATRLALGAGSIKALNVVMLGCWFGSDLCPFAPEDFMDMMLENAPAGAREVNSKAFLSGVELGRTIREKLNAKAQRRRERRNVAAHKRKSTRIRK